MRDTKWLAGAGVCVGLVAVAMIGSGLGFAAALVWALAVLCLLKYAHRIRDRRMRRYWHEVDQWRAVKAARAHKLYAFGNPHA